jgi:hypothetical protein
MTQEIKSPEPLGHDQTITFEEALVKIQQIKEIVGKMIAAYPADQKRGTADLPEEYSQVLADCIGVLLPLSIKPAVQENFLSPSEENITAFNEISFLMGRIFSYLAHFKNTGVTQVPGSADF